MSALQSCGMWDLIIAPYDAKIMSWCWVFTVKYKPDGTIDRYKTHLVAYGFTQTYAIDYFETFSPFARVNSIWILFSLAINQRCPLHQLNVKNAFLFGDLEKQVYMEQHPVYVAHRKTWVCKLMKAIYGLKQNPCAWFTKFNKVIKQVRFKMCNANHSIFARQIPKGCVILAVYVDDILLIGSDSARIEESRTFLKKHFVTKDLGRP